jgi:hypothetical protein
LATIAAVAMTQSFLQRWTTCRGKHGLAKLALVEFNLVF